VAGVHIQFSAAYFVGLVWLGRLVSGDTKSERLLSFFESNTSKYVKVLNFLTKIATFSAKSSYLRIVGSYANFQIQ
jgi:hypothetical protein